MKITDVRKQVKGKKLHHFDSWNSHQCTLTVTSAHKGGRETMFTGINQWGKKDYIYIANELVETLLTTGEAKMKRSIEYCTVELRYRLE